MKDLLKISDLSQNDILSIIELAIFLKKQGKENAHKDYLKGKTLGMIFNKPSTRTRVSFEVGMKELGGDAIFMNKNDMQLGRGESIEDTARVLSRYVDIIMIRTESQEEVEALAKSASIPVINGLTSYCHPTQALADLMTIKEHKGRLEGVKLCYIGDGNNVANSLITAAVKTKMKVSVACPKGYEPDSAVLSEAKKNKSFSISDNASEMAKEADCVYTDVWVSMGKDIKADAKTVFSSYQVNEDLMSHAKCDAMVQHCLPAIKGEEISYETFEKHAEEIFDEAENRKHIHKAIMLYLCGIRATEI